MALKTGLGIERMSSGETKANAIFFRIGVLAYNLFFLFRGLLLEEEIGHAQVQAGSVLLKVALDILSLFQTLRKKSFGLFLWV